MISTTFRQTQATLVANQKRHVSIPRDLRDNPRVNTDIDIQDIKWPWFSQDRSWRGKNP